MGFKMPPARPRGPHESTAQAMSVENVSRFEEADGVVHRRTLSDLLIAPIGWSAERCKAGHFLPESYPSHSPHWTMCECGRPADDDRFAVRQSSTELLRSTNHAQQAMWWHVSRSADLFVNDEEQRNPRYEYMHWGEFDTVMHHFLAYLQPFASSSGRMLYLYSAVLRPERLVAADVFVENQGVAEHGELKQAYDELGPIRYLNVRERPGSISLLARKSDFVVHQGFDLEQHDHRVVKLP